MVAAARAMLALDPSPANLSVRAVARRVGVSANAPYRHFRDREALLAAVAAEGYRDLVRRLQDRSGAAAVGEVWQRVVREEAGLASVMVTIRPEGDLAAAVREWLGAVAAAVESTEEDAPVAVLQRAVGVWAAVHGLSVLREGGYLTGFDPWMLPEAGSLASRIAAG
jgi:AcrR family transcriptional regulator